jgi:hypothetical protein
MRFRRVAAVLAAGLLVYLTFLAWSVRQGGGEAWTGPASVPTSEPGIDPVLIERLEASTVSVRGLDCRSAQFGTGFVVAEDLIATGAHVVAGIAVPIVVIDGREVPTRVVAFDPVSDLALLKPTSDLDLPAPLVLGWSTAGGTGNRSEPDQGDRGRHLRHARGRTRRHGGGGPHPLRAFRGTDRGRWWRRDRNPVLTAPRRWPGRLCGSVRRTGRPHRGILRSRWSCRALSLGQSISM